jgi:phosphomannomutase
MSPSPDKSLSCFKAYDIRGKVPDELDDGLAYAIGQAYAAYLSPGKVVIGHDIRLSSPGLSTALIQGFIDAGVDVVDIGLCGTEEVYFAAFHLQVDGGIMITASHNPMNYNGMKLVREGAKPISGDTGLRELEKLIITKTPYRRAEKKGACASRDLKPDYIAHLLDYVSVSNLKPLKIVANPGNGCAGPVLAELEKKLPFTFTKIHFEPDGTFPHGIPNPLLPENRRATAEAVRNHEADLGIAWDGDFDRCFFFDENGDFIEGYYLVGLLAAALLKRSPGAKIIHDPRLVWNTREIVTLAGGKPVMSKTGHAFIKERMRRENALYGGEMSAHHYFRDFAYCDSGMIPWLLVTELISTSGRRLSELVRERQAAFPVSGEINRRVTDPDKVIEMIGKSFSTTNGQQDFTDGLSFETPTYRFNIRKSNTEPLLRLNVETRGDQELLRKITEKLLRFME